MRREGTDENNLQPEDFLCDFCGNHWTDTRPMVEGHRGSLICGQCLSIAYTMVVKNGAGEPAPEVVTCALCLQHQETPHWRGFREDTWACTKCIRQSAAIMQKDPESGWKKPE
ncbi:MAG TPA: ClpX C4-type zinc finger protein [Phycisphaerales bacterium]|nr:ClpX C4-type zinc finger protein [Phycisphaerales bacterium]